MNQLSLLALFQPSLTIRKIDLDIDDNFAEIRARPKGLLAMLLSMIGLGKTYTYVVSEEGFTENQKTTSSEEETFIPWAHVSSCVFNLTAPIHLLVLGLLMVFLSLPMFAGLEEEMVGLPVGLLVIGLILVICFFLAKKRTDVGVVSDAGSLHLIRVNAKGHETEDLRDVYDLIRKLARQENGAPSPGRSSKRKKAPPLSPELLPQHQPSPAPLPRNDPGESHLFSCPSCGKQLRVPTAAIGKRVSCPGCHQSFHIE